MLRVKRLALSTPQPLQVIPEGLAMITWARAPATSTMPCNWLGWALFTSLRITRAVPVASQGLPGTQPPRCVWVWVRALLRIAPEAPTSSCW
ncbi:hypothetical protein LPH60_00055 [Xylella taiwanensis]|nr:hypothetical protein [Xylella taiwanensis]MCD8468835.1 hypothetical protein [Xylella taiwanensis]